METCRKAKVIPTASASMLVATARGSIVLTEKEPSQVSSGEKDSRIIVAADDCQQNEGDPMVDIGDQGGKRDAQKIPDQRHSGLKTAEPKPSDEGLGKAGFSSRTDPYRPKRRRHPWTGRRAMRNNSNRLMVTYSFTYSLYQCL